jgi:hypothetical protein
MTTVLSGGCLCSAVRFLALQRPQRTLACHCTFCQRLTASPFYVESIFPLDAVEFEGGEIRTHVHTSDTSRKKVYVHFCNRCSTTLGLTFERWPEIRAVSRSCFDLPSELGIDAHIWTRSAQDGVVLPADVDCYEQSRYRPNGEAEVPVRHSQPVYVRALVSKPQEP